MNTILNYLKTIGITLLIILIGTIIITFLNYFGILNSKIINIISLILPIITLFYGGYRTGRLSSKKGYIEGLKIGIIFIILITIFNLIFNDIKWFNIIYYVILVLSSILGSMLGINKRKI